MVDLTGFDQLITFSLEQTEVVSVNFQKLHNGEENSYAIATTFNLHITSLNTFVAQVKGFQHSDLTPDVQELLVYNGPRYVVYNVDKQCVRAIEQPAKQIVIEECEEENFFDSAINQWTVERATLDPRKVDLEPVEMSFIG